MNRQPDVQFCAPCAGDPIATSSGAWERRVISLVPGGIDSLQQREPARLVGALITQRGVAEASPAGIAALRASEGADD